MEVIRIDLDLDEHYVDYITYLQNYASYVIDSMHL